MRVANSPSPRMRRAKTPFARCPCTKTAIRAAGAVNHPHHINCMNHSSNKCQRALVHAPIPVNPSNRRKRATSPTRTRPPRPRARPSPTAASAVMRQKFLPNLTQSLANSRLTLLHLYVPLTFQSIGQRGDFYRLPAARIRLRFPRCPCTKTAICAGAVNASPSHKLHESQFKQMSTSPRPCPSACATLHPPQKGLQRGPCPARDATRAASASLPSALFRPKFLAQSHTISRNLSSNAPASLRYVDISKNWTKRRLQQAACGKNPDCDSPGAHARRPRSAPPPSPLIIPIT